jgi:hypothetical protein
MTTEKIDVNDGKPWSQMDLWDLKNRSSMETLSSRWTSSAAAGRPTRCGAKPTSWAWNTEASVACRFAAAWS